MDNDTRKLLDLTDKNLIFEENWLTKEKNKGITSNVIIGKLTDNPKACPRCGVKIQGNNIVKNGTYATKTQLPCINKFKTFLKLKRDRFLCKECSGTFSAKTPLVDDNCHISRTLKYQIAFDLKNNWSCKSIANLHMISDVTVNRVLNTFTNHLKPNYSYLPTVLSIDEFKATKSCQSNMSFICIDAKTHNIIDIISDRRVFKLTQYFMKYSHKARCAVKFLVMDMNANYGALLKVVFPCAQIITDRFHIIQHINRNLNQLRITTMKKFRYHNSEEAKKYRKLKRYWRLLLKDHSTLDYKNYYKRSLFNRFMTETEMVDELISYDDTYKLAYNFVQTLKYSYSSRNSNLFFHAIQAIPKQLPKWFQTKFNIFKKFKQGVINSFKYPYSNGAIEGINNKIKVIKRVAYGYRNFFNFKRRIFLIQGKSFITN